MSPFRAVHVAFIAFRAAYAKSTATSIAQGRHCVWREGRIAAPHSRIVTFVPVLVETIQQLWNIASLNVIAYVLG